MRRLPCNHGWSCVAWLAVLVMMTALTGPGFAAAQPFEPLLAATDTGDLKLKAEAGDAAAQEAYAGRLETGHHYSEAAKWYWKAAEAGRAGAQHRLGGLLLKGRPSTDANRPALGAQPLAAIHWLTQAARQDHAPAQMELYQSGVGVAGNPVEAYMWFLLAAENLIVARGERDRLALSLTSEQIQKAKQRATAFRAGDRSDPRIKIVTQADLQAPANASPAVSAEPAAEAIVAAELVVLPPAEATTVEAEAPAVSAAGTAPVTGSDNSLDGVYRLIFWLVAICGFVTVGMIGLVVLIAETRQRRKAVATGGSEIGRPATAPTVTKVTAAPPRLPTAIERLRALDWFQFEKLMELVFTREGHQVTRRGGAHPDGGIDLELDRGSTRTAVQCKHWKHRQAGIKEVREFLGAMTAGRFERGIFVTISNYTVAALEFARRNQIEIMDGAHVLALVDKHQVGNDPEFAAAMSGADKRCPKCENKLVRRPAQKGPHAGGTFWGCSTFPRCRFVMEG